MPTWAEIAADPRYVGLSPAAKELTRAQYLQKFPDAKDAPDAGAAEAPPVNPLTVESKSAPTQGGKYNPDNTVGDDAMFLKDSAVRGLMGVPKILAMAGNALGGVNPELFQKIADSKAPPTLSTTITGEQPAAPHITTADDAINAAEGALTDVNRKPSDETVRKLGRVAEFIAPSALGPIGAVAKAAGALPKVLAAVKGAGMLGAEGLGVASGGDVGKAIGDATGIQGAGDVGESLGEMAGGGLTSILAPAVLAKYPELIKIARMAPEERAAALADNQFFQTNKNAIEAYATGKIKSRIAAGIADAGPQADANLARAEELKKTIPGYAPNLGQATGAAGIIGDQQAAISSSSKAFDAARQAEQANAEALSNYLKTGEPQTAASAAGKAVPTAEDALGAAVKDKEATYAKIESNAQTLRDQARAKAMAMQSDTQPAEAGAAVKQAFEGEGGVKQKLDSARNAMYEAAGDAAKKEGAEYSLAPVVAKVDDATANPHFTFSPNDIPNVATVLGRIKAKAGADAAATQGSGLVDAAGKPLTSAAAKNADDLMGGKSYDDMTALLRAARDDKRSIMTSPTMTNADKQLKGQVLDSIIDDVNGQITKNADFPETAAKHMAADQWFANEYAPRVREGVTRNLMKDRNGVDQVLDEKVIDKYTNSKQDADQFVRTFGKGSDAMLPVAEHMRQRYHDEVLKNFVDSDGMMTLRPKDAPPSIRKLTAEKSEQALIDAHDKWMRRNGAVIDALDKGGANLRKELGTAQDAIGSLGKQQFATTMARKELDDSKLSKLLDVGTDDVNKITATALGDPAAMKRLTDKLGQLDPQANVAVARSVMNDIANKIKIEPDQIGIDPDKMGNMLKNNSESLKTLFKAAYGHTEGMRHFQKLTDVFDALKIQARAIPKQSLTANTIGQDPLRQALGFGSRTLFNVFRAVTGGRTSHFDAAIALGGQAGAHKLTQTYNKVMQEILSDPERTRELMSLIKMERDGVAQPERMKQAMKMLGGATKFAKSGLMYYMGTKYMPKYLQFFGPSAAGALGRMTNRDGSDHQPGQQQ